MKTSDHKKSQQIDRSLCRHVQDILLDDLEGQLPAGEQEMVSSHLKVCPRCASERATMKQTLTLLDRRELPEPDESFWMELRYRVRQGISEDRSATPYRPAVPARAWVPAVVVASLLTFLFLWWAGHPQPPAPGISPLLSRLELEGQRSLRTLSKMDTQIDALEFTSSPGDSLVELLVAMPQPTVALERALIGEKMTRDPELWESVIEEEVLSERPVNLLIEELDEDQLRRLSTRLKNLTS
jgi:hypothetical protein